MTDLHFDPKTEIPDLSGKVILITGGTAGLGASSARTFAAHNPAQIVLSGRNQAAADKQIAALSAAYPQTAFTFLRCDLASLSSVQAAARAFLGQPGTALPSGGRRLDILLCNAGIMTVPAALTADGYEVQFGTNHVGHALLIKLLLPALSATAAATGAPSRCVLLSSQGYAGHPIGGIDFAHLRDSAGGCGLWDWLGMGGNVRYGQSKLANLLTAAELARRVPAAEVVFASVHPGIIHTGLVETLGFWKRAFIKITTYGRDISEEQGGWNGVWASTAEVQADGEKGSARRMLRNGYFYFPVGEPNRPMRMGTDKELARKLWDWTEAELRDWAL